MVIKQVRYVMYLILPLFSQPSLSEHGSCKTNVNIIKWSLSELIVHCDTVLLKTRTGFGQHHYKRHYKMWLWDAANGCKNDRVAEHPVWSCDCGRWRLPEFGKRVVTPFLQVDHKSRTSNSCKLRIMCNPSWAIFSVVNYHPIVTKKTIDNTCHLGIV